MIAKILAMLFSPQLPGKIRDWDQRIEIEFDEQGSAGPARPKKYRDGIDRHFAEERKHRVSTYFPSLERAYPGTMSQLRKAEEWMIQAEGELVRSGFVNTIHDCWERTDD